MGRQIETSVSAAQLQAQWPEMLEKLRGGKNGVAITEDGAPTAVLLPYELYEGMLETMEILANTDTVKQLVRSMEDAKQGRYVYLDNLNEAFE